MQQATTSLDGAWRGQVRDRAPVVESYAVNYGTSFMSYRERRVSAESADSLLAFYVAERERFTITRKWEAVCYSVSVSVKGDPRPFVAWLIAL